MITEPDPTPEQRRKTYRSYRLGAVSNLVYGVVFWGLTAYELAVGRRDWFVYWTLAFGAVWLVMSWVMWTRARKYQSGSG